MLRTSFIRLGRVVPRASLKASVARPMVFSGTIRHNSSQTPQVKARWTPEEAAKKEALRKQDDLQRDWDAKVLTYEELLPKTQSPTANTYLIDVREPDEVAQGMIPSAVNIPLSILSNSLALKPTDFKEKFGFEKPAHDQEVIFYCRSGKRSTSASDVGKRNGYTNILNYKGSWLDWTDKQNPQPVN